MNSDLISTIIIDDEDHVIQGLTKVLLDSQRWEVLDTAQSPAEAVQAIIEHKPSCIFCDINLLEGDAFLVAKLLRAAKHDVPPIILMTGHREFDYARRAVNELGSAVVHLLEKPFFERWSEREELILSKLDTDTSSDDMSVTDGRIRLRIDNKTFFINTADIQSIEVAETGSASTKIYTTDNHYYVHRTMRKVVALLPDHFVQISRQSYVNASMIVEFDHEDHTLRLTGVDHVFSVGDRYKKGLLA